MTEDDGAAERQESCIVRQCSGSIRLGETAQSPGTNSYKCRNYSAFMTAKAKEVTADVGTVYRWEIESNPTTGYNWYLRSEEGLKVETEFIAKSDLCGAPGVLVFLISSDKKGTFDLIADYKRPWEKEVPVKTEELKITFR